MIPGMQIDEGFREPFFDFAIPPTSSKSLQENVTEEKNCSFHVVSVGECISTSGRRVPIGENCSNSIYVLYIFRKGDLSYIQY